MRNVSNWLDSYLNYAKAEEAPDAFHLWCALWAISAVIERKAWVDFGYFQVYPNMYIILTGPPASHKGTAAGMVLKFLTRVEGIHLGPDITTEQRLISKFEHRVRPLVRVNVDIFHINNFWDED